MKKIILILCLTVLLVGCGDKKMDTFAQCLTDSGAVMYGAFWCSHCSEQKLLFGESFQHIKYVECSNPDRQTQTKACEDEGISSYPTWKFSDGSVQTGVIQFADFEQITGCKV